MGASSAGVKEKLVVFVAASLSLSLTYMLLSDGVGVENAGAVVGRVSLASPEPEGPCMAKVEYTASGPCEFKGCPADERFLYVLTSYRNRGAAYNRFIVSMQNDIESKDTKIRPECVCAGITDYNDEPFGPTLEAALEDWKYSRSILTAKGKFSRAGGFQLLLDNVITTPRNQSVVFFMDADMITYPGLIDRVMRNVQATESIFAPVCWSQDRQKDIDDWYAGKWRIGGTGMIAFVVSDFDTAGGCLPMADSTSYGGEDAALTSYLQRHTSLRFRRECTPELWHLYHSKKGWGYTLDGIHKTVGHYLGENPWDPSEPWKLEGGRADAPQHLEDVGEMARQRCQKIKVHTYV